jgi:small subunit ribosomal protein S3
MGHKIRPDSFRLGIIKDWDARWFARKGFKTYLEEDELIRSVIFSRLSAAGITRIEIERSHTDTYRIHIKAAKPGLIIGRGGKGIEEITKLVEKGLNKLFRERGKEIPDFHLSLNVEELKRSEISSQYVAQTIAWDLEKRLPARRVMKRHLEDVMQNRDAKGVKIRLAGRINGAEIARAEVLSRGRLPLHTLRANIDYGTATARTTFGTIGIKVWIYKGDVFESTQESSDTH